MKYKLLLILSVILITGACKTNAQIITTVAGDSTTGYCCDDSLAINAELNAPTFVALDGHGNFYISEWENNRIRKVNTSGIITTIAGIGIGGFSGDGGAATNAKISYPVGLKFDKYGNLFFADEGNARVRKIDPSGIITTIAGSGLSGYSGDGGLATDAKINNPHDVAIDNDDNLYFTEFQNCCIRKVNTSGIITTFAGIGEVPGNSGDGSQATAAKLYKPYGISLDGVGNMYVADYENSNIRKIDVSGIITTIAGTLTPGFSGDNGPATAAQLKSPAGVAVDAYGNVYIGDALNYRIRKINNLEGGIINTIAGNGSNVYSGDGGPAIAAGLLAVGVTGDGAGNLYIADYGHSRIRYIENTSGISTQKIIAAELPIYPNPTDGQFTIKINDDVDKSAQLLITDITGKTIKEITVATNQSIEMYIDVPPGFYYINAFTPSKHLAGKLVIMK